MRSNLDEWVRQAKEGHREALEEIVRHIQDRVYGLSLRMLGHPADAEDASQEILIKVITHLDAYREESAFTTWVYRVASNHLLTTHKRRMERVRLTFSLYEQHICTEEEGHAPGSRWPQEQEILVEEIRASCMQGLLLCLGRELRLAFILGQIFEVTSEEGAYILDVTPTAFRKRLSRGRTAVREFLVKNCGVVNPANPCSCARQLGHDIEVGWIDPDRLRYADATGTAADRAEIQDRLHELDEMGRVAFLLRNYPSRRPPEAFAGLVKELLDSGRYALLDE